MDVRTFANESITIDSASLTVCSYAARPANNSPERVRFGDDAAHDDDDNDGRSRVCVAVCRYSFHTKIAFNGGTFCLPDDR